MDRQHGRDRRAHRHGLHRIRPVGSRADQRAGGRQDADPAGHNGFPDGRIIVVDDQIAEGDKVASRWTARGTQTGEVAGIAPTGKGVTVSGLTISRLENGMVVEGVDDVGHPRHARGAVARSRAGSDVETRDTNRRRAAPCAALLTEQEWNSARADSTRASRSMRASEYRPRADLHPSPRPGLKTVTAKVGFPEIAMSSFFASRHMPCADCGASVAAERTGTSTPATRNAYSSFACSSCAKESRSSTVTFAGIWSRPRAASSSGSPSATGLLARRPSKTGFARANSGRGRIPEGVRFAAAGDLRRLVVARKLLADALCQRFGAQTRFLALAPPLPRSSRRRRCRPPLAG